MAEMSLAFVLGGRILIIEEREQKRDNCSLFGKKVSEPLHMSKKSSTFAAKSCKDMNEKRLIDIFDSIRDGGFSAQTHAGLCLADSPLIGAYAVCGYARASFEPGRFSSKSQTSSPSNWEIDAKQEECVEQWARAKGIWFSDPEKVLTSVYGSMIAKGAEAKVYYKSGDTSVIKERTSIYATLDKALEAIVLHNALFPETQMTTIGFTRDSDGLFRIILTQPYIGCQRLATKAEIDEMVASKGFHDNGDGNGVNYIGDRLYLEDMHPANVFIDALTDKPICIDCIVKFIKKE